MRAALMLLVVTVAVLAASCTQDPCVVTARANEDLVEKTYQLTDLATGNSQWRQLTWMAQFDNPVIRAEIVRTRQVLQEQMRANNAYLIKQCGGI